MTREILLKSIGGAAGLFELELSMRVVEKLILFLIASQFRRTLGIWSTPLGGEQFKKIPPSESELQTGAL